MCLTPNLDGTREATESLNPEFPHLGRSVDPDSRVEQDVVTQLLEKRSAVAQAVQVLRKTEELLQHSPGDVHPGRLHNKSEPSVSLKRFDFGAESVL